MKIALKIQNVSRFVMFHLPKHTTLDIIILLKKYIYIKEGFISTLDLNGISTLIRTG